MGAGALGKNTTTNENPEQEKWRKKIVHNEPKAKTIERNTRREFRGNNKITSKKSHPRPPKSKMVHQIGLRPPHYETPCECAQDGEVVFTSNPNWGSIGCNFTPNAVIT